MARYTEPRPTGIFTTVAKLDEPGWWVYEVYLPQRLPDIEHTEIDHLNQVCLKCGKTAREIALNKLECLP